MTNRWFHPGAAAHWLGERIENAEMRAANVVGSPVAPPPDADEQERLLAFLGRDHAPHDAENDEDPGLTPGLASCCSMSSSQFT